MRVLPRTRRGRGWALAYLGLVLATVLFIVATFTVAEARDGGANLSPVWLAFVTLPWSLLLVAFLPPDVSNAVLVVALLLSASLNAVLIGRFADRD